LRRNKTRRNDPSSEAKSVNGLPASKGSGRKTTEKMAPGSSTGERALGAVNSDPPFDVRSVVRSKACSMEVCSPSLR
jgi:hypothetical protein